MKQLKKLIAIVLSIAMVMGSTLPSFASENDALQEKTESKIVDQLKEDLGKERAVEILGGNVGVSTDGNFVEVSTASPEEDTSMGELCEPEEDEEESVNEYELSEPEEDETEAEQETDRIVTDDELESEELESDENGLTEETIVAETEEAISETEIIESSEVESNDDEVVVVTDSEIQDSLLDLHEIVSLSSNEKLLGAGEPWMWWYLTDEGHTIHYTNSEPSVGGHGITTTGESTIKDQYSTLNIGDITKAVFDNEINAVTCVGWFMNFINLITVENINYLKTNNVTNFSSMFEHCSSLTNLDVSGFDTSSGKYFSTMFFDCSSLTSLDVSGFNTSRAITMFSMFEKCSSLTNLDVSGFDVSNVTSGGPLNGGLSGMFFGCSSLTGIDVSNFNTSNITNMRGMFYDCSSLTSIDVSNFNTSNVTNMREMFRGCSSLTSIDVSNFDTRNVTNMGSMFYDCSSLTSIDVSNFNTSNVTDMSYMFRCGDYDSLTGNYNSELTSIVGLNNFDTSNVTNMESMFGNCSVLEYIDVSNFDTRNVTNISFMFHACQTVNTLDVSSFETSNVIDMYCMFNKCNSLTTIYASDSFDTSAFTETSSTNNSTQMFALCYNLIGGNGTVYDVNHIDKTYARIDTVGTPGYFTFAGGGAPTLSGITVNTLPTKVKYKVGETFDPTGLKINLNYSDSSTTTVTYNSTTSSDFTFSPSTAFDTAGNSIPVTITYSGKNCIQNVVVIEPQSISIKTAPTKVKYAIGETFDPTGLSIEVTYSDGTTKETVTYAGNESNFTFNPSGALNTAGNSIPITITYTRNGNNFDCVQNVEVVELSTITINTAPSKTRYIKGTNFDPTGLKINLNYSDGTTNVVEYNSTTSYGFTFNGVATLTLTTNGNPFEITIGYAEKTTTQNVIVAELDRIEIATHATKLNYMAGDTFNPAGLVIKLIYTDSFEETVAYNTTTSSSFTFSPSNTLTRTGNVITVTYGGKSTNETLNVKELTGITIATNPTKLSYATGQSLNPAGLVLTLTYNDSNNANTTENVTYNSTTQSKFAFNPSGTAITTGNVTVTYDGKTGAGMQPTFNITVRTVASISVINRPNKTSYSSGNKLALSGLSIKVNYTNGTNETVAYSPNNANDFIFSPSTSTSLNTGHNSVAVTYGGKTTSFAISVSQSTGGYVPSNGGGSSGGSGGGGGGGGIPAGTNPLNNTPATTQVSQGKSISGVVNSDTSTWTSDPLSGKYKLNTLDASGNPVPVSNGFYMVTNTVTEVVNNVPIQTQVNNTYYFDTQGNMVTGWVQTADNKWFFFENAKTADEGKMSLGWKQVQGSWYYFTADGSMMENGITPDGFIIGADGKWVG